MIGVVGPDRTAQLTAALEDEGADVLEGGVARVCDADVTLILAVDDAAFVDVIRATPDVPVLPVTTEGGVHGVGLERAMAAARRLVDGDYELDSLPTAAVEVDDAPTTRILFDVLLVTAEPVRISEYRIGAGAVTERVRADGVVVATSAGSLGYAGAAGSPRVDTGADAISVVPVGAFRMDSPSWVFAIDDGIELAVTRQDCPVAVVLDGRAEGHVEDTVGVGPAPPLTVVSL